MRYSAFEQAAAEASYGMHEIDTQLEQFQAQLAQIKTQMEQLQSKRDVLEKLSHELLMLRPDRMAPAPAATAPAPGTERAEAPQQPEPPRTLRETWGTSSGPIPDRLSAESILRARG